VVGEEDTEERILPIDFGEDIELEEDDGDDEDIELEGYEEEMLGFVGVPLVIPVVYFLS